MGKYISLNKAWLFHLGDVSDADYMGYDDSAWRRVNLPHDWAVEHPFDKAYSSGTGYLPGGIGWYRKHFTLTDEQAGKRVRITFGGVYKHARVWVNSNYLGGRAYGYSTFTFDISEFVRPGENVICVRCEHTETADSRWFTGSGIYRDVTLEICEKNCFKKDGVFITTEAVDENSCARLRIAYETLGCDGAEFSLIDRDNNCVASASSGESSGCVSLTVGDAQLWSTDSPYLYSVRCVALSDGKASDELTIPFGIRTIRFDADEGFFLNGVNMKLKGVCVHHDGGALGAAVPPEVWERRLLKFKASGCNALRTAHNPPSEDLLYLCDRLGLLVMDEAFDEWEGAKNKWWQGHNVYPPKRFGYAEDFPFWHKADLEEMILRDRNHPSVILWSIGNEIDYPNDPYVTPLFDEVLGNNDAGKPAQERKYNDKKPDAGRLTTVARELVDIVHAIDTSRPVLSAMSFPELSTRTGFADVLDVSGYNYRERFYDEDHKRFPDRVIFGSENSHDPSAWYAVSDNDFICGQFLWTGIDFLGECRGWPIRISQAGMLDLCGFEKPLYYQRKALWSDEPFVKLAVSRGERENTSVRTDGFIYAGDRGEKLQISCYTNADSAELFLNGKSLGAKRLTKADGGRISWEAEYEAGELTVRIDGAEDSLKTPDKPARIVLKPLINGDIAQVEVEYCDRAGNLCPDEDMLYFELIGGAELLGIENGKPDDLTCYAENCRRAYLGRAIAYIRLSGDGSALYVRSENGIKSSVELK